jgi:sugar/nucleoside kinase (ribokinase family)
MSKKIIISGTGCSLVDRLFNNIRFDADDFTPYLSRKAGDGGLVPGQLVFVEEFEKFTGKDHTTVLKKITGNRPHDKINIGGPSIVSLIHASQLSYDLDCEFRFYGGLGDDAEGRFILSLLEETPLNYEHYLVTQGETPYTLVLSDPDYNDHGGERIFINSIGAAWNYTPDDLDDSFFSSDIVVFGGTALVPRIHDALTGLLQKAKQQGCITVVNTVYDFRNEKSAPGKKWPLGKSDESYRLTDLLITDHEEALRLSGEKNIEVAMAFFRKKGTGAVIVTHGAQPVRFFSQGSLFRKRALTEMPVSEAVTHELKNTKSRQGDTTGCGDNFAGGVLYSLVDQILHNGTPGDIAETVAWGIVSGGTTTFYMGGMYREKKEGEKKEMIRTYYEQYRKQIRNLQTGSSADPSSV